MKERGYDCDRPHTKQKVKLTIDFKTARSRSKNFNCMLPAVESQQAATRLAECIKRLHWWMGPQNGLKLNAEKTQLMWLGSRHQLAKLTVSQLPLATTTSSSTDDIVSIANDPGIILDGQLTVAIRIYHMSSAQVFFPATSAAVRSPISDDRGDTCHSPGLH